MTMVCPTPMSWVRVNELYVTDSPCRNYYPNNAVQFGLGVPDAWGPQTPDVWHLLDFSPYGVPSDAKVAFVSGILVITHGETNELAGLKIGFRKPGDTTSGNDGYISQVGEAMIGGGVRSGCSCWVPLVDAKTEMMFNVQTSGMWPEHSSYACNLTLQAWGR